MRGQPLFVLHEERQSFVAVVDVREHHGHGLDILGTLVGAQVDFTLGANREGSEARYIEAVAEAGPDPIGLRWSTPCPSPAVRSSWN